MKRLGLGLAVLCAVAFGLSATGGRPALAQTERQMICPSGYRPSCGYGAHASCTPYGWACVADRGGGSSYGGRSRSSESCLGGAGQVTCQAGWLPRCHDGHWRCVAPSSPY
ncbi:MAG: hypothetical protein JSR86_11665 [Proteobacteria bacterium]|nr:hypothetical protein [Pseudomonadota bacterium]